MGKVLLIFIHNLKIAAKEAERNLLVDQTVCKESKALSNPQVTLFSELEAIISNYLENNRYSKNVVNYQIN